MRPQRAAISRSCVTSTSVVPFASLRSKRSSITRWPVAVSRLPVGSSANSTAGRVDEGAGDGDALLLAAGELARVVPEPGLEPDLRQHGTRARARVGTACELERQHHVLEGGQRRHEVEGLEHEPDVAGARLGAAVLVQRGQLDALDPD